jgi:hypothetical protein
MPLLEHAGPRIERHMREGMSYSVISKYTAVQTSDTRTQRDEAAVSSALLASAGDYSRRR